jgi:hypothetical protein
VSEKKIREEKKKAHHNDDDRAFNKFEAMKTEKEKYGERLRATNSMKQTSKTQLLIEVYR